MKKGIACFLVLFTGLSSNVFAASGYAYDGLAFLLVVVGILLVLAGTLWGIDYLKKNGKQLRHRIVSFIMKKRVRDTLLKPPDPDLLASIY